MSRGSKRKLATYDQFKKNQANMFLRNLPVIETIIRAENTTSSNSDNSLSGKNKTRLTVVLAVAKLMN